MNLRRIWTELVQKPAGRLLLFLLTGGIFLAFVLLHRPATTKPDNRPVVARWSLGGRSVVARWSLGGRSARDGGNWLLLRAEYP